MLILHLWNSEIRNYFLTWAKSVSSQNQTTLKVKTNLRKYPHYLDDDELAKQDYYFFLL